MINSFTVLGKRIRAKVGKYQIELQVGYGVHTASYHIKLTCGEDIDHIIIKDKDMLEGINEVITKHLEMSK